jgi:hypothetical protein
MWPNNKGHSPITITVKDVERSWSMSKEYRIELSSRHYEVFCPSNTDVGHTVSQRIVLELLKELGGKAKTREVSNLAKIRYPDSCLHEFVGHKLERLATWGYVYHDRKNAIWLVMDQSQNKIIQ